VTAQQDQLVFGLSL